MSDNRSQMTTLSRISPVAGLFVVLAWLTGGCGMYRPGHGNLVDRGPEPVQKIIEAKIAQQRQAESGQRRWESFKADEYQSLEDIVRNRDRIGRERRREQNGRQLTQAGPFRLVDCLTFGLEFNDNVQARRSAIQAVGGDELIVRSRFLPHLFYDLDQENKQSKAGASGTDRTDQFFRLSQTLLEFGKDNEQDVVLRESQRTVLFAYEDAVSRTLSQVRIKFFTILLREQQLAERHDLLLEFREQYERIRKKYEKKIVVEVDVLTARLNMLNEETRINSLKKEILRQKFDLLHLLGFPVGMTDFELQGKPEAFGLDLDQAVDLALKRSTDIAQTLAVVAEQRRKTRQVLWEYGPELQLQAGWKDNRNAAGFELKGDDGFYDLSTFAEHHIRPPENGFLADQDVLEEEEQGWFLGLSLELPIFQGLERRGRYAKHRALLNEARHTLRETIDRVERDIRKSYQTLLERREELRIREETVVISKKRLKAKDRLNQLDRITDDELETFRERFFRDQDAYFAQQIDHIEAQEQLRFLIRHFETLPENDTKKMKGIQEGESEK